MNKKKQTLLMIFGILGLIAITASVTYAFFSYTKQGTTENTVTTGTITFLYTEIDQVGAGISLTNAFPISDEKGKALTGDNEVFDFKITSDTLSNSNIPYEITARKKQVENMLDEEAVRIYLTKNNGTEEEVLLDNYSNLTQTSKVSKDKYIEKTLHTDKVPANVTNYEQAYRLRMWVDEKVDFSPVKDENGNDIYPYNGKEFTVTVNVYANAKVVTDEEIVLENNANISGLAVNGEELAIVDGKDYQYETSLSEGTTTTIINVETESKNATVEIEKLDSLAYSSNTKRLSASRTLQLTDGNNYFKVTVTSENKKVEKEFILRIKVGLDNINTLDSLNLSNCTLSPAFDSNTTSYTCTVNYSVTSTEVTAEPTSNLATTKIEGNTGFIVGNNTVKVTVTAENESEKIYTVTVKRNADSLSNAIFNKYKTIYTSATLTNSSNNTSNASGLYKSTATNDGKPTYYFRGNVTNNYVKFAGFTWRVVRINEDGTVRIIMSTGINSNTSYAFNSSSGAYARMYYTNSSAKTQLNNWYTTNITNKGFSSKVATGNYYCEQAKVKNESSYTSGSASMAIYTSYTPNFKCAKDGNGKGIVNASVGLITYDELVHAGGYGFSDNKNYYLYNGSYYRTMSPAGVNTSGYVHTWDINNYGRLYQNGVHSLSALRPVLNLKADTTATGSGTSASPWVVQ